MLKAWHLLSSLEYLGSFDMAKSILSALSSKPSTSFINENTGVPCWTAARIVDVSIISDSDNANSPLSNQQLNEASVSSELLSEDVKTAKILRPSRLRVTIITDNISLIENVLGLFADVTVTISITSKSIVANSMSIVDVEVEQSSEMLSASKVIVTLEQVIVASGSRFNPAQDSDSDNYGLGVQSPSRVGASLSTAATSAGSLLSSAGTAVTSLYNRIKNQIGV